jgi:hypothetical protein
VAGRFIALEQLWLHDEVMRLVAFSPRLAGPAAELLGEPAIRIYHDNALSKERYTDHVGGRTWSAICPRSTDSSRRGQRYISGTFAP